MAHIQKTVTCSHCKNSIEGYLLKADDLVLFERYKVLCSNCNQEHIFHFKHTEFFSNKAARGNEIKRI